MTESKASLIAVLSILMLIALCIAWELWLSPLRPGGSWLVLKVIPLLFPLHGILKGRRYTYQWSTMLILGYFAEGIVRAVTEDGTNRILATVEIVLTLTFFIAAVKFIGPRRKNRDSRQDSA
jgi:uncharacterized membrane protein